MSELNISFHFKVKTKSHGYIESNIYKYSTKENEQSIIDFKNFLFKKQKSFLVKIKNSHPIAHTLQCILAKEIEAFDLRGLLDKVAVEMTKPKITAFALVDCPQTNKSLLTGKDLEILYFSNRFWESLELPVLTAWLKDKYYIFGGKEGEPIENVAIKITQSMATLLRQDIYGHKGYFANIPDTGTNILLKQLSSEIDLMLNRGGSVYLMLN